MSEELPGGWLPPSSEPPPREEAPPRWPAPERPGGPVFERPAPAPPDRNSGKATAALVLGIVGMVVLPFVCSALALYYGYRARGEIDASGGRLGGRGNATAGIVLGWVGLVFGLLVVGFVVADA